MNNIPGKNTLNAFFVSNDLDHILLTEEVRSCSDILLMQGMKYRMTRSICRSTGPVRSFSLTKVRTLATKGSLVYLACFCPRKGNTQVFKFNNKTCTRNPLFTIYPKSANHPKEIDSSK